MASEMTRTRRWHKRRSEGGQSIIELALVTPVFLLMLAGVVDLSRWVYAGMEVASAARAAVQYGSLNRITAADSTGMTHAAQNDTPDVLGLAVTPTLYCQCSNVLGTNVTCALASCTRLVLFLQVDTSAVYKPVLHYPFIGSSVTVKAKAVMRVGE